MHMQCVYLHTRQFHFRSASVNRSRRSPDGATGLMPGSSFTAVEKQFAIGDGELIPLLPCLWCARKRFTFSDRQFVCAITVLIIDIAESKSNRKP